ncbi:MAG: hypothetical protein JST26_04890 [Bacteroidetes bacterium]|nr:hypothetical protein [Bacteroidota bacterium]
MKIKRIVHGDFADPNSTRDITGLSGKHLEVLVNVLQACILGAEMLTQMNPKEAREYIQAFQGKELTEPEAKELIAAEMQGAKLLAEILEGINQPYKGAIYPHQIKGKA